jgi:hypothetical protein
MIITFRLKSYDFSYKADFSYEALRGSAHSELA